MKNIFSTKAFTLIEILVAMFVCSIIVLIFNQFLLSGFKATTFNTEQETAIENARNSLNTMMQEIRGANSSDKGDYAISQISTNTFVFYNDINKDGKTEKIKYYLDGTNLNKAITSPGTDNNYTGSATTSTLAQYVNNKGDAIFRYYDNTSSETATINRIKLISINLKINVTPSRAPDDYTLQTDVTFRNLINL